MVFGVVEMIMDDCVVFFWLLFDLLKDLFFIGLLFLVIVFGLVMIKVGLFVCFVKRVILLLGVIEDLVCLLCVFLLVY